MTSPYLNLRIRGLSFLNDILDLLNKKELAKKTYGSAAMSYYSYGSRQHVGEPTIHWLTSSWVCSWVCSNDIVEI